MRPYAVSVLLLLCAAPVWPRAAVSPPLSPPPLSLARVEAAARACESARGAPAATSEAELRALAQACEAPVGDARAVAAARALACLAAGGALPAAAVAARGGGGVGGRLLFLACARKHFALAAALVRAGAPASGPAAAARAHAGFGPLHAALATDLASLDATQKLLLERAAGCGGGAAGAGEAPPQAATMLRAAAAMAAHQAPAAQAAVVDALTRLFAPPAGGDDVRALLAQLRVKPPQAAGAAAAAAITAFAWPAWVAAACERSVATADTRALSNALAALLARVLTGTTAARLRTALTAATAACGSGSGSGGSGCAAAAERALDEARAAQDFFFAADARGRTALHVAAACGNAQALAEVAAATFAAANETLVAAGLLSGGEAVRDRAEVGAVAATQRLLAARDVFGYTAADTARLRGDTASAHVLDEAMTEGARRLGLPPPPPPPPPASATAALTRAPRGVDDDGDDDEDDGGWSVTHDELLARASPAVHAALKSVRGGADCDIAVIDELVADGDAAAGGDVGGRRLTAEQFLHQHVAAGVPALLRGHARAWPLRADLRRDAVLARYGDMDFPVAALPYARSFGGEVSRASLRDYAATALLLAPGGRASVAAATAATRTPAAARVEPPLYIFDAPGKSNGGALALDAQGEPAAPPRWSADALAAALLQRFNATPAFLRSRVPLHAAPPPPPPATLPLRRARDLAAALRELVDSRNGAEAAASTESTPLILCNGGDGEPCADAAPVPKPQFYIGGPGSGAPMHVHKDAFNVLAYGEKRWLLLPPRDAVYSAEPISEWLAAAPARGNGTACTQRAGDVIFVPRGWGHAVLNTRTSVGIALEFSAATGLPL